MFTAALKRRRPRKCQGQGGERPTLLPSAQGLGSKNNRTKIECCEELGCIIEREGIAPLLACKAKPMAGVAALLTERDGATRAAALATIELAWVEEGDNVWKLFGRCVRCACWFFAGSVCCLYGGEVCV